MSAVKGSRRERAAQTRSRIIGAAHAEFVERGFHGATIASIAERAGVAPQTVYFVFHTKTALISAVIDAAVLGPGEPTVPQESAWWAEAEAEADAADALRILIRGSAPIFARVSAISEVLRFAAATDEELRALYAGHEGLREEGFAQMVDMLAAKGPLKKGLDAAGATDLLLTIYGDTTYCLMTTERGWSHDRFVDWLCDALPQLLLEPKPRRRRSGTEQRARRS